VTAKGGRPPFPPEQRTKIVCVSLRQRHIDYARKLGDGNVSKGVRKALALLENQESMRIADIGAAARARLARAALADPTYESAAAPAADFEPDQTEIESEDDTLYD